LQRGLHRASLKAQNAAQISCTIDGRIAGYFVVRTRAQTPRCRSLQHVLPVPASGRVLVPLVFYTGGASITRRPQKRQAPSIVKIRDVIKMLEGDGWSVVRQRGSHRQFKHASKPGLVTVAGKPGDDLAPGTLNSVLKQAGLKQ
jgi:predicted RNA binding protein YcfA (HicA-like mRNA interferase family)